METLVQIGQGSVSVQAGLGETYVEVYDGTALVVWNGKGEGITLTRLESVVVPPPGGALQALLPPQDLVVHGDFLALEPNWQVYSKDVELEGEPGGEVALATGDTPVVGFTRIGRGHAETGITQTLDRDVQGVQSLQLRLALRVIEQDVPVCGTRGTECPIMVEIKYEDVQGDSRSWLQGFYVSLDPNRANPPFCTVCSPRADHLRVEQGDWYEYDSPNLIPLLNQAGPPPARLVSIVLYASGHTYRSEVSRVELLARE